MTEKFDKALVYCKHDPLLHTDMSEALRRGTADLIRAGEHGVLLFERESGAYMVSADSASEGERLLEAAPGCRLITVHQGFLVEPVKTRFGLQEAGPCFQAVYTGGKRLPVDTAFDIRPLEPRDAEMVTAYYHILSPDEIGRLICGGAMIGGFDGDVPAGFAGIHAEGGMGLLFVRPDYRRRGLAAALESSLINRILEMGRVPFGQIFEDNTASLRLQQSLGLTIAQGRVNWLY